MGIFWWFSWIFSSLPYSASFAVVAAACWLLMVEKEDHRNMGISFIFFRLLHPWNRAAVICEHCPFFHPASRSWTSSVKEEERRGSWSVNFSSCDCCRRFLAVLLLLQVFYIWCAGSTCTGYHSWIEFATLDREVRKFGKSLECGDLDPSLHFGGRRLNGCRLSRGDVSCRDTRVDGSMRYWGDLPWGHSV